MSEAYVIAEEPYSPDSTDLVRARGDGTVDDAPALQHHINLMSYFGERRPLLLAGVYRLDSPLGIPGARIKLRGFNRKTPFFEAGKVPSTLYVNHTGTAIEVTGQYFEMEGLNIRTSFNAQGPVVGADNAYGIYVTAGASNAKIVSNQVSRVGGKAGVRIDVGGIRFEHNEVTLQGQTPPVWSYDATILGPVTRHAVYLQSVSDSFVAHNQLAGQGGALFTDACSGCIIHDNLIFNSMEGIVLQGATRCTVHDNRVDEHYRQGIVVDWNTSGCVIHDNLVHNNGAWTANPNVLERAGLVLRSGSHNNVHGNMFDNWDHDKPAQPGNVEFDSPQQIGLVLQGVAGGSTRLPPTHNLINGNVFRNQIAAPIWNNADTTNKFIGNTGSQFPGGLYTDPSSQPVSAGLTGPAAAVAAGAAGLVALRNRGRRAPSPGR